VQPAVTEAQAAATQLEANPGRGPLSNFRLLEIASMWSAPIIGNLFASLGAEVVKIERPGIGDELRTFVPTRGPVSLHFLRFNANKKSVAIDLHQPEGQELVRQLVKDFDVVVTSYRPQTLAKWSLDHGTLTRQHPQLVVVVVTGYGLSGPYSERPAFGTIADAVSGYSYIAGSPEKPMVGSPLGMSDIAAGISGALGALVALQGRSVTGRGDVVDVALYEPFLYLTGETVTRYTALGMLVQPTGGAWRGAGARGVFKTSDDRWIAITSSTQSAAERLLTAIGHGDAIDDPRYATKEARALPEAEDTMIGWLAEWIGARTRDVALQILIDNQVTAGPVNDGRDIVEDSHISQRSLVRFPDDGFGEFLAPGYLFHLRSHESPAIQHAPTIGQHTDEILKRAEVPVEEIASLRERSVIA
jgi:crotonobetainyl-CoA:carnitine CoA-transferase CaiB-like acyl-CoA transferase